MMTSLLLLGAMLPARAADLASAAEAVAHGDLGAAETELVALLEAGYVDADVYYDLGSVAWRAGRRADALLAWRRAEVLAPRDPDVGANLDFARRGVVDALPPVRPVPLLAPWQASLSVSEAGWAGGLLVGMGLLALALGPRLHARGSHLPTGWIGGACLLAGGLLGGGALAAANLPPVGVVRVPSVSVTSDLGGGIPLFTLHEGAEVLVAERSAGQVLLTLPDERKGWVAETAIGLADPYAPWPSQASAASVPPIAPAAATVPAEPVAPMTNADPAAQPSGR